MANGFKRVNIASAFTGINQAVDERYLKPGESRSAANFRTDKGILSTAKGYAKHISAELPAAPVAPMLYYHYDSDGTITEHLLVSTANDLYRWTGEAWSSIKGDETITSGDFSYVNFREEGTSKIILSNGTDPVYQWTGTGSISKLYYESEGMEAPRGKCLASHVERLWVGGVNGYPNTVFWSDNGRPSVWTSDPDMAGEAVLQTWDGGRVIGLATLLGDIVVFEPDSIFRVVGTYPGEFRPVQIMAVEGTIAPRSICQYANRAYFISDEGLMVYDTVKAYPLIPYALRDFWSGVNLSYLDVACGIAHNGVVYMAVPYGTTQKTNNRVIEYNIVEKTVCIRNIVVTRFLEYDEDLLFAGPDKYVYKYDSGTTHDGAAIAMTWDTPVTDFGTPGRKFTYDVVVNGWTDTENGQIKIEVMKDGSAATSKTITLPAEQGIVRAPVRANGRVLGFRISNVSGSAVNIVSLDAEFDVMEDI